MVHVAIQIQVHILSESNGTESTCIPLPLDMIGKDFTCVPKKPCPCTRLSHWGLPCHMESENMVNTAQIARFMGPIWGPSGADKTQVGPMLAPRTLLSGWFMQCSEAWCHKAEPVLTCRQWNPREFTPVWCLLAYSKYKIPSCVWNLHIGNHNYILHWQ